MKLLANRYLTSKLSQAGLLMAVVLAVAAISVAWSDNKQANKLEGAWIGKMPGSPVMWSYALSPDPSGKTAALSGAIHVPLGPSVIIPTLFPDMEYYSPMVGQMRMTGPDTVEGTAIWYGMKKGFPFNQVVFIGLNNAQGKFTGTGEIVLTNHLVFYAPTADVNKDGLPDPDQEAALCLPGNISVETQVPVLAPCVP